MILRSVSINYQGVVTMTQFPGDVDVDGVRVNVRVVLLNTNAPPVAWASPVISYSLPKVLLTMAQISLSLVVT